MHRNLDRRVEVQVRITDPKLTGQLDAMFESAWTPRRVAGCWSRTVTGRRRPADGSSVRDHQAQMLAGHRALA